MNFFDLERGGATLTASVVSLFVGIIPYLEAARGIERRSGEIQMPEAFFHHCSPDIRVVFVSNFGSGQDRRRD